jgi:hypothetical protein
MEDIVCKTCFLLPLCLQDVHAEKNFDMPFGYALYLDRWVNQCNYTYHSPFLEIKRFFLIQKGFIKENEYGPGRY